jgi:hypothetical protein
VSAEGAVGVATNPVELIRWILNNIEGVRRELARTKQTGLIVKLNGDAVAAHQAGCVTVLSLQIVLEGLGNSVTTVVPVGIYNGNDHASNAGFHFSMPLKALERLGDRGLKGVRGVVGDPDQKSNIFPITAKILYVLDGAAQREWTGSSSARMRRPMNSLSLSAPSLYPPSLPPLSAHLHYFTMNSLSAPSLYPLSLPPLSAHLHYL